MQIFVSIGREIMFLLFFVPSSSSCFLVVNKPPQSGGSMQIFKYANQMVDLDKCCQKLFCTKFRFATAENEPAKTQLPNVAKIP